MLTAGAPPLDLLIRTSGVERLSDFMLWQCHENTSIVFLKCLWPEFDLWQFLPVLVEWQWQKKKLQEQLKSRALSKAEWFGCSWFWRYQTMQKVSRVDG
jgi:ditrans,polycis-polyprenyl diphosphate synthase